MDFPEGLGRRASMGRILKESTRLPPLTHTRAHARTHGETTGYAHSRRYKATDPLRCQHAVSHSLVLAEARLCAKN